MSRKLDAAIAEALGKRIPFPHAKHYSTDGNAMLELDGAMEDRGYYLCIVNPCIVNKNSGRVILFAATYLALDKLEKYRFEENLIEAQGVKAKDEPLARALAAYKALTGKEWAGE